MSIRSKQKVNPRARSVLVEMLVVFVVLCVASVRAGEAAEGGDSEAAVTEEQWAPFFSEASRASEGLPWDSVAPVPDQKPAASSAQNERGDAKTPSQEERKDVHKVTITKKVKVPYTVHVEKRIPKIIEVPVDKPFNVYVPKPYPVIVEKKVPYEIKVHQPQPYTVEKRVPYPVKVLVDKPYTLHVPKPYPVDVEKKYEFTVEKKMPYEVKVPVERPYPVHVIVEKEVKFPVEKKVPVPVKVPYEKPIPIHVTKHVPVPVDKPVPYTVEKVTTYPVKVPFRIPIKVHYPEGGSVEEVHGEVQNYEWAEAMNSATKAAKLESRPAQWHGTQYWQAESQKPSQWQEVSHRPLQGQAESQRPSQWHEVSQRPSQVQAVLLRPSHVRHGFSSGRGLPTRNGYLLGKHSFRGPTTKLQPVGHYYQVKEPQLEQPQTAPFLTRPGSEVIVPQMILADSLPNNVLLQHSSSPSSGLQQTSSQSSGLQQLNSPSHGWQQSNSPNSGLPQLSSPTSGWQQSNSPNSGWQLSNSPSNGQQQPSLANSALQQSNSPNSGLRQPNYLHSSLKQSNTQNDLPSNLNPSDNSISNPQQNSALYSFSNAISQGLSNQHSSFVDHQNNKTGTQSFSITNVIHHTGAPSQQTVVNHRTPITIPEGRPQAAKLQHPNQNSLVSESAQSLGSRFFKPAQNHSTFGTKTAQNPPPSPNSATSFGMSGFTISFQSPAISHSRVQQQTQSAPQQGQSQQLFKPSTNTQPAQNSDHISSSYVGTRTVREGQELTYSNSIHHDHNSSNKPEQR